MNKSKKRKHAVRTLNKCVPAGGFKCGTLIIYCASKTPQLE